MKTWKTFCRSFTPTAIILSLLTPGWSGPERADALSNPEKTESAAPAPPKEAVSDTGAPAPSNLTPESPYRDIEEIEEGKIVHLPTGVEVSPQRLVDLLASARVVYVGEVHDSVEDHRVQLEILRGLWERFPGKVAVGMEMFRRPSQPELDRWVGGKLSEKEFIRLWMENWGENLGYYRPLLDFIREKKVRLIALNAGHDLEGKVGMKKGVGGLSDEDRRKLPEIDRNDPYHRQALEAVFKGHGPGSEGFDAFYDTMLLWDETMAESVANYLSSPEGADRKMVVFAGGFHVGYGFGIPRRVFRRLPAPYQIVIPHTREVPEEKKMMNVKPPSLPLTLADFVWGVQYKGLDEKKVRLGVQIDRSQTAGVQVREVTPGSAAASAGVQPGDVIVSFGGETIKELLDLTYAVQQKSPGERVKLQILRGGKTIETEAVMQPPQ